MGDTKIEWTDKTWNPTRGCSRVSKGCEHCYAERIAARFASGGCTELPPQPFGGFAVMQNGEPHWTGRVELIPDKLDEPLHWRKPRRVFVNSMSDLFHEALPDEAIDKVFAVMALCPQHTFQVLTKRPERMRRYLNAEGRSFAIEQMGWYEPTKIGRPIQLAGWPLPNVWLGVSVENQQTADERIPLLLRTPAEVRFLSYEPALGPLDLSSNAIPALWNGGLHWVIAGGESGPHARPFDIQWARGVIAQCKAAGAVGCFVKQLGSRPISKYQADLLWLTALRDRKGGDWSEWPADLRVREFPPDRM